LTGCKERYINLKKDDFKINIGEEVSTDLSDYVRANKKLLEKMTLDVSAVDVNRFGTYECSITYEDTVTYFDITVTDLEAPEVVLKKDSIYIENAGHLSLDDVIDKISDESEYTYGFSDDMTLADSKKTMLDTLQFATLGEYNCEIIAKDSFGNTAVKGFKVCIVEEGDKPVESGDGVDYSEYMNNNKGVVIDDINTFDTNGVYYGVGNSYDSETGRPNLAFYELKYGQYKADFIQPDSSYVWLTFNEIYEYGNTAYILDVLKEKEVSAVFFVTMSYAQNNPDLVKRMVEEGHVIGSYTTNGVAVPNLPVNSLTSELDTLYNYVYETYGYEMYLFRTPSGYFSEQALAVAQNHGYRTVFWSFAYSDWNVNAQPEVDTALENALAKVHGGAIYQLSASSTTNKMMLNDLIDGIRAKGYEFAVYQKN
jgi:peptidoglycan-N-acetylmuramic acid deacetylase